KETMLRHFDGLIEKSHSIDPGILGFAKSERARLLKSIDNLEKKLIRAEKKKHSDSLKRISTIRSKFLPGGILRERNENFLHWYLRYGEEFLDMLLEMSDPLEPKVKVVKI
ncbi:MAG: bacillithiol biosynthesis BshC, partial [Flavobacteriales bacterium]|nr:bacillithiol biosynthesis BshC [Flavobacteriales bacterium]